MTRLASIGLRQRNRRKSPLLALVLLLLSASLASGLASRIQDRERSIADIVESCIDTVVLVIVSDASGKVVGRGSGFLISPDGKIVTNYHVVQGAASAIVKLSNGAFFPVVGVLATSKDDDLALIKVSGRNLPALSLGDSGSVSIGDRVIAIGSPLGLQNTVTDGIVRAVRDDGTGRKWIQTTAPASRGNSGGPLLTLDGNAIGVITFGFKEGENLNFAAPINSVKSLLDTAHDVVPLNARTLSGGVQGKPSVSRRIWTSMVSGRDYTVRIEGEYIYSEWVNLPREFRETSAFNRAELKRSGDIWTGKSRSYFLCQYRNRWTGQPQDNWCSIEIDVEITSFSESRIEARVHSIVEFDCRRCRPKKMEWKSYTLIPKDKLSTP